MTNRNRSEVQAIGKRPPVTDRQIEIMLAVLIRKKNALVTARSHLFPETFADHHRHYSALWAIALDYYDEFNDMPPEEQLAAEIESRLDQDPTALSEEEIETIDNFLRTAYAVDEQYLLENLAFKYLKEYLEDRLAAKLRNEVSDGYSTSAGMFELLSRYQEEAGSIGTLTPKPLASPFEEGWDNDNASAIHKVASDLPFLSNMTNGGIARGEVLLLMGPHGSCKTTIAVQMACEQALSHYENWDNLRHESPDEPLRYVYMFFYEGTLAEMRMRCLSYAARIARESLEEGDVAKLSRAGSLKDYELKDPKLQAFVEGNAVHIPGELERYRLLQQKLNRNLRIVDMTGNDQDFPGRGYGMVDEMVQVIRGEQELAKTQGENRGTALVVIDYAGAAVERHMDHNNIPRDRGLRFLLNKFPMHCKNKLAVAFDCPVLLMHQLSGAANAMNPGKVAKGTDAAESKTVRENTDWCMVLSNPDKDGLCVVTMDKHRRAPSTNNEVIRINGRFCRVDSTDGRYFYDQSQGKIVNRSTLHSVNSSDSGEGPYSSSDDIPGHDDDDDIAEAQTAEVSDFGDP